MGGALAADGGGAHLGGMGGLEAGLPAEEAELVPQRQGRGDVDGGRHLGMELLGEDGPDVAGGAADQRPMGIGELLDPEDLAGRPDESGGGEVLEVGAEAPQQAGGAAQIQGQGSGAGASRPASGRPAAPPPRPGRRSRPRERR